MGATGRATAKPVFATRRNCYKMPALSTTLIGRRVSVGLLLSSVSPAVLRLYIEAPTRIACQQVGSTRGDRGPWAAHILGGRDGITPCPHAGDAKKAAIEERDAKFVAKQTSAPAGPSNSAAAASTSAQKHGRSESASHSVPEPKRLKQGVLQVFSGREQTFTRAEVAEIEAQTLRATVSAGVPFRVWENREVLKLIGLFRTAAPEIMPSRKIVAGRLLDDAAEKVESVVKHALQGREIGLWYVVDVLR